MNQRSSKIFWFQRFFGRRVFLFLNLAILGFLVFSFGREFAANWEIQKEIEGLEARAESLKIEHLEIEQLVSLSQTEAFLEKEARLKMGLNKPGENVVIINNDQPVSSSTFSSTTDMATKNGILFETPDLVSSPTAIANPLKWWYYFFDAQKFSYLKHYGK